jgi:hypothetical protein
MDSSTPESGRFRPRFSLLTVLLVMALVACGITIWQLWRELNPLRDEVERQRNQLGELTIRDETKTHAIQVDTLDDLTWKWRIWVPPGKKVFFHARIGEVPKEGFPKPDSVTSLDEGDHWVTFSLRKDPNDGSWKRVIDTGSARATLPVTLEPWFIDRTGKSSRSTGIFKSTAIWIDESQPFLLLRNRVVDDGKSAPMPDPDEPTPGFLFWLETR